jgi:hypothetical protein
MELPGRDNRNAKEAVILSRTELEALVSHHQTEGKKEIDRGQHDLVKQRMERIEKMRDLMPRQQFHDY